MRISKRQLRQLGRADEGQALVAAVLALVVLMLVAGLGVDAGYLRYQKQQMQKAADAGALAGASTLVYKGSWKAAAVADVSANGFTATNGNGVTVRVDKPWEGSFAGQDGYVEVSVSQPQPTFFMRVGGFNSMPVRAWSVASALGYASGCIYVLDPTSDKDTYTASGAGTLKSACGLMINSDGKAFEDSGSACTHASYIAIVGTVDQDACSDPAPGSSGFATGIIPFNDPLAWVPRPVYTPCISWSTTNVNGGSISPDHVYCGGISINGGAVTMNPGLYIIDGGGFTVNGGGTSVSGTDVTIFDTGAASGSGGYRGVNLTGGGSVTLSAPTSGTYAGILFYEDRNVLPSIALSQKSQISGGTLTNLTGALYFPTSYLAYTGGSDLTAYTDIVAYQLVISGPSQINDNYSTPAGGSPIHSAALAE